MTSVEVFFAYSRMCYFDDICLLMLNVKSRFVHVYKSLFLFVLKSDCLIMDHM